MLKAKDKAGHTVYIDYMPDTEIDAFYCVTYSDRNGDHQIDDFCAHTENIFGYHESGPREREMLLENYIINYYKDEVLDIRQAVELTIEQKMEILGMCEEHIDNYKELCGIALGRMSLYHCDLGFASPELFDGIREQYEEWCYDNDLTPDEDFDVEEELFFFDDPGLPEKKEYLLTPLQQQVIIDALRDRIGKLYDIAAQYTDNTDAKKDCYEEARIVKKVLEEFLAM